MSESAAKNISNVDESSHELVVASSSGTTSNDNEQSEFFGGVLDKSDLGPSGSLNIQGFNISSSGKYDPGIAETKKFLSNGSPYPDFCEKLNPMLDTVLI